MTSSLHPFDQPVNDLLSKLLDDELDKGELCYLADQLRCSSQARQLYYDHIALHAILRWMDGGPQQEGLARVALGAAACVRCSMLRSAIRHSDSAVPSPCRLPLGPPPHHARLFPRGHAVGVPDRDCDDRAGYFDRLADLCVPARTGGSTIGFSPLSPLLSPLSGRPDHRHG